MFSSRTDWSLTPNRLSIQLEERRRRGLPVLDLTESNPTCCGFSYNQEDVLRALADPASLRYRPDPRGPLVARKAVADYYAERGVRLDPAQIFLTTSTSEAYSYVFRLLADPGDKVLVPRPGYPLLDFLSRLDGLNLTPYRLHYDDGWQIDLGSVRAAADSRTRAILLVHPNNPTGSFVRPEEFAWLLDFCLSRRMALLADEVFVDYAFTAGGTQRNDGLGVLRPPGGFNSLFLRLSGLSKISGLPQMKLAWITVDGPAEELKTAQARLELIADTYLSVSTPAGYALPKLLEMRRRLQPQILERTRSNLAWLDRQLASGTPVGRLKAEGGWYAVLRLPSDRSSDDWAIELLAADGVLVHPGHFYDFASEGYMVVSLLPPASTFQEGMGKLLARVVGNV